jgi:hypothetical protein
MGPVTRRSGWTPPVASRTSAEADLSDRSLAENRKYLFYVGATVSTAVTRLTMQNVHSCIGALMLAVLGAAPADADGVRVAISMRGDGARQPIPKSIEIFARQKDQSTTPLRRAVTAPAGDIELPPGVWTLEAHAPGFWGSRAEVRATRNAHAELELWPAATVAGKVSAPSRGQIQEIMLSFGPANERNVSPKGSTTCPVASSSFVCAVPASLLHLRVGARRMVPHYRWNVRVARRTELGIFSFSEGASISGYVLTSAASSADTELRLTNRDSSEVVRITNDRGRQVRQPLRANPDRRGFFQIGPLAAGHYVLAARDRDGRTGAMQVVVETAAETRLPAALPLSAAAEFEVRLNPPMAPGGVPWELRLMHYSVTPPTPAMSSVVPETGLLSIRGVGQGDYALIVEAAGQRWLSQMVQIGSQPESVDIEVPLLHVSGTVTLGRRPLASKVIFGGQFGTTQIQLKSNESGHFEGHIPKSGRWRLDIRSESPAVNRSLYVDVVERTPGFFGVDVALPNTLLDVEVVDDRGTPVHGAVVHVQPSGKATDTLIAHGTTDDAGRLTLHGLPEGPALLSAEAWVDLLTDANQLVNIGEDTAPVRVRLSRARRIKGRLTAHGRPVPGGFVGAVPLDVRRPVLSGRDTTDAMGEFDVRVPPSTRTVRLTYGARGYATRTVTSSVGDHAVELPLVSKVGRLVILTPKAHQEALLSARHVPLIHNDVTLPLAFFIHDRGRPIEIASTGDGTSIVLDDMEPGVYAVCREGDEVADLASGQRPDCTRGVLAEGGELILQVPRF